MNIDQLTTLAEREPFGRGSTSRLRLAGGTLWYKDDHKMFLPILSHGETFMADWGVPSQWENEISSRAHNQLERLHNNTSKAWLCGLGGIDQESDGYTTVRDQGDAPAVRIRFRFPARKAYRVAKPNAVATKMLLRGRHPEDETDRVSWSTHQSATKSRRNRRISSGSGGKIPEAASDAIRDGDEGPINPYKDLFGPAFEKATTSLAYGAVRRENTLRDMTQALGQLKNNLDTSATNMVKELGDCAKRKFTPANEKISGTSEVHLHELVAQMVRFERLAGQCRQAADIFSDLASAPDSIVANVSTPSDSEWTAYWPETIASLDQLEGHHSHADHPHSIVDASYNNSLLLVSVQPPPIEVEDKERDGTNTFNLPRIEFWEHNKRGFSYYWMRRYKMFYEEILGKIDCSLPDFFGKASEDWNYLELAGPVFAAE